MSTFKWWIAGYTHGGAEIRLTLDGKDMFDTYDLCMQAVRQVAEDLEHATFVSSKNGMVRASEIVAIMAKQS